MAACAGPLGGRPVGRSAASATEHIASTMPALPPIVRIPFMPYPIPKNHIHLSRLYQSIWSRRKILPCSVGALVSCQEPTTLAPDIASLIRRFEDRHVKFCATIAFSPSIHIAIGWNSVFGSARKYGRTDGGERQKIGVTQEYHTSLPVALSPLSCQFGMFRAQLRRAQTTPNVGSAEREAGSGDIQLGTPTCGLKRRLKPDVSDAASEI